MTPFEHDIIDLHIALENWLGKGEGDSDALLARFRPDFLMIPPGGVHIDYHGLVEFLHNQRGSRPGLKIVIDELTTRQTWPHGAVLHYRETQTGRGCPSTCAGQPRCLIRRTAGSHGVCCTKRRCRSTKEKGPSHDGPFLTKGCLFAEQRFDIQTLPLQDFTQAAQTFYLNLTNTFTGQANFAADVFQCRSFIPQ